MMTGHEVGAALGVALVTAVAGDLTTRAGLIAGYADAFVAVAVLLVVLLVPTALVPRRTAARRRPRPRARAPLKITVAYPLGVCYVSSPDTP